MNIKLLLSIIIFISAAAFSAQAQQKDTAKTQQVIEMVDTPPEYPGGMDAYMEFLKNNIKYPADAMTAGAQGTVYVSIRVEKDGTVTDVKIKKDAVHYGCGEEAVRVLKLMPKWKPGTMNGIPVAVLYTIPVKFILR
jgi:periplasmic protein TonB